MNTEKVTQAIYDNLQFTSDGKQLPSELCESLARAISAGIGVAVDTNRESSSKTANQEFRLPSLKTATDGQVRFALAQAVDEVFSRCGHHPDNAKQKLRQMVDELVDDAYEEWCL